MRDPRDPVFNRPIKDPLLKACMKGDTAELERLLSQGPKPADFGPLADYALSHPAMLEVLLDHGLDPNLNFNEHLESMARWRSLKVIATLSIFS